MFPESADRITGNKTECSTIKSLLFCYATSYLLNSHVNITSSANNQGCVE